MHTGIPHVMIVMAKHTDAEIKSSKACDFRILR